MQTNSADAMSISKLHDLQGCLQSEKLPPNGTMRGKKPQNINRIDLADLGIARTNAFFYAGHLEALPPSFADYKSPHRHSYYAVFFFISGTGVHTIDFEDFSIEPGTMFFLKPGQVHSWRLDSAFSGFALKVSREFCASLSQSPLLAAEFPFFAHRESSPRLKVSDNRQLRNDFERLIAEYQANAKDKFLFSLAHVLLHEIDKFYSDCLPAAHTENPAADFLQMVDDHIDRQRSVHFYARELGLPPARLNQYCKLRFGISAGQIIRERLTLEIRRLLLHSEMNIAQIARGLNFQDPSYFSRFVRKNCGASPENLRTQAQKVP